MPLRERRKVNGSYVYGFLELHSRVNVGLAISGNDALLVATVLDADTKPLDAIAAESQALAEAGRKGTINPRELSGATFTVSNPGMVGIPSFTAVVNPPQAAILAVGAITLRPVVRNGESW